MIPLTHTRFGMAVLSIAGAVVIVVIVIVVVVVVVVVR